ncbi:MAG: iron-containing alcohol dehydrogenase [Synergistaceae bacterium]|nr:iron-containing alcohol dehydrogenase [Synergistaceae bacterium]
MKTEVLRIGSGIINSVAQLLHENKISGKILYVSGPIVDGLYGSVVKEQIKSIGRLKEEYVDHNTIEYSMSIAERIIATDIDCIVGLGGGKVLDVCKYAAYISKVPFLAIATTMANDGLASPIAVLKRKDNLPKSLGCAMPSMLIVDTKIMKDSPEKLLKQVSETQSRIIWLCWTGSLQLPGTRTR